MGCTGGSSPTAAEERGLALGKGSPKPAASTVMSKFPSSEPYGAEAVEQISRNAGLEGKSSSLRRAGL